MTQNTLPTQQSYDCIWLICLLYKIEIRSEINKTRPDTVNAVGDTDQLLGWQHIERQQFQTDFKQTEQKLLSV